MSGLPDAILADRGELLGSQVETLENSFSVRIENAPPYRGDAKGIVERYFHTLQASFKPYAPGVVGKTLVKKRGGKDYRLDAKLTLREFREILVASVLAHNQTHHMEKYDRTSDMPDDLPMTPLDIWNWGVQHRTGRLRKAPEDAHKDQFAAQGQSHCVRFGGVGLRAALYVAGDNAAGVVASGEGHPSAQGIAGGL